MLTRSLLIYFLGVFSLLASLLFGYNNSSSEISIPISYVICIIALYTIGFILLLTIEEEGKLVKYKGNKGFFLLSRKLNKAKKICNVRFSKPGVGPEFSRLMFEWDDAIVDNLNNKEVIDIVTGNLTYSVNGLLDKCYQVPLFAENYQAFQLNFMFPPCINFTILELEHQVKEVWFGWVSKRGDKSENYCIKTRDAKIIALFEGWFNKLLLSSEAISIHPKQTEII